jgi:hypothetical protein
MAIGAKVSVESGGGNGMAIIVVTAIKAAIIDVRATILLLEVVSDICLFTFFSLRQYYLVQVLRVDSIQPSSQPGHNPSSPNLVGDNVI